MNIWKILKIDKTDDEKLIKKAYHTRLRQVNPEDDPKGFMELRSAYESAISYAKSAKYYAEDEEDEEYEEDEYYDEDFDEEYDDDDDEYWESLEVSEDEKKYNSWLSRVNEVYEDYDRRIDKNQWNKLLYEDIPIKIKYYNRCRESIRWRFIEGGSAYVPDDVRKLFDKFFSFAGTEFERAQGNYVERDRKINKKIKLNENIEFSKLMQTQGIAAGEIDAFFRAYEGLVCSINLWETDKKLFNNLAKVRRIYEDINCVYLPYECIHAALQLKRGYEDKAKESLNELKENYGDLVEVQLLEAQYCLYLKEYENARMLLKGVYKDIPVKSYPFAYQMAVCCKMAGMYYEAYEFIKYLTYLKPEQMLFDMADEVCELLESELNEKSVMTDEDKISMCRIYLRSDRTWQATDVLKTVSSTDSWEYNVAKCLCAFNEEEVPDRVESYENLEKYPKENLNTFQKLEWEELQARYLYEKKAYMESLEKCNEILQDYPIAYSILLLRAYVDYTYGALSDPETGSNKDYFDMDYLISINKKRTEAWLLTAAIMRRMTIVGEGWMRDSLQEIEHIKDARPQEYEYCRLRVLGSCDYKYKEAMQGWKEFWTFVRNNQVKTPAVSKYCLLDLHEMYEEAAKLLSNLNREEDEEVREYYELLCSLSDSKYNHPEKYMDLLPLYFATKQYDKAEPLAYERLDNCNEDYKIVELVKQLLNVYRNTEEVDKAEKVYNRFRRESDKKEYAKNLGIVYYDAKEYEKGIEIYEYARKHRTLNTIGYALLGDCYENCENYEMAEKIREEGILYCSKSGDYWTTYNIYYDNYLMFNKLKNWEKALYYLELTERYSEMDNLNVSSRMGEIYRELMEPFVQERNIEKVEMLYRKAPKHARPYTCMSMGDVYNNYVADNEDNGPEELIKEYKRKAIDYYMEDIENGSGFMSSYGQASYWLETLGDDEGARQILERGTKVCIDREFSADYWGRKNLFYKLAKLYQKLGNMEKLAENLELMLQHCELESKEDDYNGCACYAYFKLEQYEKSYELYSKWETLPQAALGMTAFALREYRKAVEHYRNSIEVKEHKGTALLIRIAHCEYMENGNKDKAVFERLRDEMLSYKGQEGYDDGDLFYILADVALLLGDKKLAEEYVAQADEYSWEDENDRINNEKYYNVWKLMYEEDYEGAYQYIETTGYHHEDSETQGLWSYLKNKLGKS